MPQHPHHQHHHHSHCHSSASCTSSPSPSPSPCCSFSSSPPSPSCCSCCYGCCPSPQSPPPDQMVVLLQSLLSNQLHISHPPPSDHHLLQSLANHLLKPYPQPPQRQHKDADSKTQSLLLSLLRRVSALESQIPDLSRPPPPPPPPVVPASAALKPSLRDLAARTIQARFREFLVRRSRTLRHLKQLAALKSHAAALRSSLSGKVRVADSERVSQRAMDLLLQLDAIQSSDLMIREGKKSITRELTRILEFIDKVSPKENRNPSKEDGASSDRRRHWQNSKAVKRVSFSEFDSYAPFAEDLIDMGSEMERLERLDEEHVEDIELEVENGVRHGIGRNFIVHNGNLGLYAPMPVHMESRES